MSMFLADDINELSFGVQASNVSEVAQFSSTLDNVIVRMYTNNGAPQDNMVTGVAIGSSNYDKSGSASNNLYFGHITEGSNINPVMLMQGGQIAINTVPSSNYSLTVQGAISSDALSTPYLIATNVNDTFANIGANTYVSAASVTPSAPSPSGLVSFAVALKGNSTLYSYKLSATSNSYVFNSTTQNTSTTSSVYSNTFSSGTYNVHLAVTTPGTGTGSSFIGSNLATFTVGATDSIGAPVVSLSSAPTFSANYTYVSGIPYYASGTTVTFPTSSLAFTRIYNTIDPRSALTNVVTINGTNYTYSSVFTNVLTANSVNNFSLQTTLSGAGAAIVNMSSVVRNINYQSGVSGTLVTSVSYLGTPITESTMPMATYTNMPISSITRMSIANAESSPSTPSISNLSSYTGTPSSYDAFYSPFDSKFYPTSAAVVRGTYSPTMPGGLTGSRQYVCFVIAATSALSTFVLNFAGATGISSVNLQWAQLGAWYDASVLYTIGGCAEATHTSGSTRYPITVPQGATLTGSTNIYVCVSFTGSLSLSGMTVSYT